MWDVLSEFLPCHLLFAESQYNSNIFIDPSTNSFPVGRVSSIVALLILPPDLFKSIHQSISSLPAYLPNFSIFELLVKPTVASVVNKDSPFLKTALLVNSFLMLSIIEVVYSML